jgi:hypothetical protein
MSIIDLILGLFGGKKKIDFGRLHPDDIDGYWRVDHDLDQAERRGGNATAEALAKYGLRSTDHAEEVKHAIFEKHGQTPEFKMAGLRVAFDIQVGEMQNGAYQFPPQYLVPPHGITLDRYAAIHARIKNGEPPPSVLGAYQLDEPRWREVDGVWRERMGPNADAIAGNILASQYGVMVQCAAAYYGGSN